jgi:hypothetical protein
MPGLRRSVQLKFRHNAARGVFVDGDRRAAMNADDNDVLLRVTDLADRRVPTTPAGGAAIAH